jgi:hypothetical protein
MRKLNVTENFLVVIEIRSVQKISMFRQPFEVLQLLSFMNQGAALLRFKPTNAINFIEPTIILQRTLHILGLACPLPRSTQLYKTVA